MKKTLNLQIFIVIILIVTASYIFKCTRDFDTIGTGSSNTNSGVIGTGGGKITTGSGAAIVVPAGALDSSATITITSHNSQADMVKTAAVLGNFSGALVLSPDGLNFNHLVTITIPLNTTLMSGTEVILFQYDDGDPSDPNYPADYSGWKQTDFTGVVSADGQSVTAQIDHFSVYVIQMNFAENTIDVLGDLIETLGDNGLGVDFENYKTYFENTVAKLGDLHVYDLPGGFGYDCYKVVGLEYNLYHSFGLIYENPLYEFKGVEGEVAFFYNYEGDRFIADGNETQLVYHIFMYVYMDRTPPDIDLTVESPLIKTGEQTDVTGCLTCGAEKMKDQAIYFSVNDLGSIQPTNESTDDDGNATITFTAGSDEGTAVIEGEYAAHIKSDIDIISDRENVVIEDEDYSVWQFESNLEITTQYNPQGCEDIYVKDECSCEGDYSAVMFTETVNQDVTGKFIVSKTQWGSTQISFTELSGTLHVNRPSSQYAKTCPLGGGLGGPGCVCEDPSLIRVDSHGEDPISQTISFNSTSPNEDMSAFTYPYSQEDSIDIRLYTPDYSGPYIELRTWYSTYSNCECLGWNGERIYTSHDYMSFNGWEWFGAFEEGQWISTKQMNDIEKIHTFTLTKTN